MPALTDALTSSSQDSSQKSQRIVHPCSRIVEQLVDLPVPQMLVQIVIEKKKTQAHFALTDAHGEALTQLIIDELETEDLRKIAEIVRTIGTTGNNM